MLKYIGERFYNMASYLQTLTSFFGNPDVDTPPSATGKAGWTRTDKDTLGNITKFISDGTDWVPYDDSESMFSYRRKGTTENRWYIASFGSNSPLTGTIPITANLLYAMPFIVPKKGLTISDIAINVVTGAASTIAKLGIYKDNGNVYPGALFHDAGSIATETNTTFATIDIDPNKFMSGGLYWFAISVNGAPTMKFVNTPSQFLLMGHNATQTHTSGAGGYYKSASYPAGAMPDPFPSAAQPNDASQVVAIYARFV
jgi:hypothetical protein